VVVSTCDDVYGLSADLSMFCAAGTRSDTGSDPLMPGSVSAHQLWSLAWQWTEPVTTVLPGHQVEVIRAIVAAGQARSMSAWVAEAVAKQLADSRERR
jgi:hypothetical protein